MSLGSFNLDALRKNAEATKNAGQSGGKFTQFKFDKLESYLLFLQKDSMFTFDVVQHEIWKGGKPIFKVGSPTINGEDDPISKKGWEIYEQFKGCGNKKLEGLFKKYLPKTSTYGWVIDLRQTELGPQIISLPKLVKNALTDQVGEAETEADVEKIFDLDKGRVMKVVHNGKAKIEKEYTVAKFLDKTAQLLSKGKVESLADVEAKMYDLRKLQPAYDDAKLAKALSLIDEEVKYIISKEGVNIAEMSDADAGIEESFDMDSSSDEFDLD